MIRRKYTYDQVAEILGFSNDPKEVALEKMGIFVKDGKFWVKTQSFDDPDLAADYAYHVYFKDRKYDSPTFSEQDPPLTITKRILGFDFDDVTRTTKNLLSTSKRKAVEKIANFSGDQRADEIERYTEMLSYMDADEISLGLAAAIDFAKKTKESSGIDFYDPLGTTALHPNLTVELESEIKNLKNQGNYAAAAPFVIWNHTLNAANNPMLRKHGRAMWAQLSRAFSHLEEAAEWMSKHMGYRPEIRNGDCFPRGMTPTPKD
jgi:flagellar hook-associated protein FlgK